MLNEVVMNLRAADDVISVIKLNRPYDICLLVQVKYHLVGDRGLEPPASASQTRRASQLRQSP